MKFEVTNPKVWKAVNEKDMPMKHKIKVYEKLGGAYRLGENGGEQVFNKMTELLKHKISEGGDYEPEYKTTKKSVSYKTLGELSPTIKTQDFDVDEPVAKAPKMSEGPETQDHEVSMAGGQLDDIIRNATELKGKVGEKEMDLPGWIQDHISQAMQFINQANTGYHKLGEK
jgi:hypothetical protein